MDKEKASTSKIDSYEEVLKIINNETDTKNVEFTDSFFEEEIDKFTNTTNKSLKRKPKSVATLVNIEELPLDEPQKNDKYINTDITAAYPVTFMKKRKNKEKTKKEKDEEDKEDKEKPKKKRFFCMTKEIASLYGGEALLNTTIREFIIFIIFFITVSINAMRDRSSMRYVNAVLKEETFYNEEFRISKVEDVKYVDDIYEFILNIYIPTLHRPWDEDKAKDVLNTNIVLTVSRLRQLRMKNDSCKIPTYFSKAISECYASYDSKYEDKEPFGLKTPKSGWRYSDASVTKGTPVSGTVAIYGRGGYIWDFPWDIDEATYFMENLKQSNWIDMGTRAVLLEFVLYNPNVNMFAVCKFLFEIHVTGAIIPTRLTYTSDLFNDLNVTDVFTVFYEIFLYMYATYFLCEEIRDILFFKWSYIIRFWSWIDMSMIVCGYSIGIVNIFKLYEISYLVKKVRKNRNRYINFDYVAELQETNDLLEVVLVFTTYLKIFKFLDVTKSLSRLQLTIQRCLRDIFAFSILLFIILIGFAFWAQKLFGMKLKAYYTFDQSVFTLLKSLLSDFQYEEIEEADSLLAPVFFSTYMFIVFFILLNMLLAIVNDTYGLVLDEQSEVDNKIYMWDYILYNIKRLLRCMKINIKVKEKLVEETEETIIDDISKIFKECEFSDVEIDMFFKRYNIDTTARIKHREIDYLLSDIDEAEIQPEIRDNQLVNIEEFQRQKKTITEIEESARTVTEQMNLLTKLLEENWNTKMK